MSKDPEIKVTDNRMEWYMRRQGITGVTMNWAGDPVLCDMDGMILPGDAEQIIHNEFYPKDAPDGWPRCPITGTKIPLADEPDEEEVEAMDALFFW